MKASYQLSEAEVVSAMKIHSRGSKRILTVMLVILVSLLLVGFLTQYKAVAFGGSVGGVVTYFVILKLVIPYNAKKQFKEYRALREHVSVEASAEGIHFESESGNSKLPWADIHYWKFSDEVYMLYVTSNLFYILPARAVSDQNEFEQILLKQIGKKKS